jgi:hypothetical protein
MPQKFNYGNFPIFIKYHPVAVNYVRNLSRNSFFTNPIAVAIITVSL